LSHTRRRLRLYFQWYISILRIGISLNLFSLIFFLSDSTFVLSLTSLFTNSSLTLSKIISLIQKRFKNIHFIVTFFISSRNKLRWEKMFDFYFKCHENKKEKHNIFTTNIFLQWYTITKQTNIHAKSKLGFPINNNIHKQKWKISK